MVSEAEDYLFTANDRIYYTEYSQSRDVYIYDISLTGEKGEIAKLSSDDVKEYTDSDAEYVKIVCAQIASNKIYFTAGSYGGSAGEYQGGIIARVNTDGTEFEILRESNYENFYILNEDVEVIIEGEKIAEPYFSEQYDLCFVKDADSEVEILLSKDEYESLGLGGYADYTENSYWGISETEVVGDKLFFTISIGKREENQDIGWRPYYTRELTSIYWKNMTTGEIYKLYSY